MCVSSCPSLIKHPGDKYCYLSFRGKEPDSVSFLSLPKIWRLTSWKAWPQTQVLPLTPELLAIVLNYLILCLIREENSQQTTEPKSS